MLTLAGADGLVDGLLHPLLSPAHVVALIGLGLVAGRLSGPARAATVAAFAIGVTGGLGAIAQGVGETSANDVLLAGAVLCGIAAAGGIVVPAALAAALALATGVALGLDSPPETPVLRQAVLMLIGTACGGVATLAVIVVAASAAARLWAGIALRVAGSWIAAIAILVLALRWAG